jgi:predicted Zn-dependent peptidase
MYTRWKIATILLFTTTLATRPSKSQDLKSFEGRITTKGLSNGLTIIICERPEDPMFSYVTLVNAGNGNSPAGESGLAHMFEHLAFKGTTEIGTSDWPREKIALGKVEDANNAYEAEYLKPNGGDPKKLKELHEAFIAAQAEAGKYVIPNEFTQVAERNGAQGFNAGTGQDATVYVGSMPENRLELWAWLESSRLVDTVPREFYKERDVVLEERSARIDSVPFSRVLEQLMATAYVAHNYGRSDIGWPSELSQISATEAMAFHQRYYIGANIVIAIVGDVKASEAMPMLEKYFGKVPDGRKPEEMTTVEPKQFAEKTVVVPDSSQPIYFEGYHRPDFRNPDNAVYDAIQDIMSTGRTSRLYESLVKKRAAVDIRCFNPNGALKYPSLFTFYAAPMPGHTPRDMGDAIHLQLEKLKTTDVTDRELATYKTRAHANLLNDMSENGSLAIDLAKYQTVYGDWHELFLQLDKVEKVTKADIRRVASETFVRTNRTVAWIETMPDSTDARKLEGVQ